LGEIPFIGLLDMVFTQFFNSGGRIKMASVNWNSHCLTNKGIIAVSSYHTWKISYCENIKSNRQLSAS